jgi:uncharacterized repeat protein (TIGR03803 family)
MKKQNSSQSGIFNARLAIALSLVIASACLTLISVSAPLNQAKLSSQSPSATGTLVTPSSTPASGTLTDTSGPLSFTAGPFVNPVSIPKLPFAVPTCSSTTCDTYSLTVSLPSAYVAANPKAEMLISLDDPKTAPLAATHGLYGLYLFRGNSTNSSNGAPAPLVVPPARGPVLRVPVSSAVNGNYTLLVAPYRPFGAERVMVTISLVGNPLSAFNASESSSSSATASSVNFSTTGLPPYNFQLVHTFAAEPGLLESRLIQGSDGNFYGTTASGGPNNVGTVFRMTPDGTVTILHNFTGSEGAVPAAGLFQATDGNFYGTTEYGGTYDMGTVFRMTQDGTVTALYNFGGGDGAYPFAGLVQASDGSFYGTTYAGGAHNFGTVFKITPDATFTLLYSFSASDGANPTAGLIQASDGNLYGTTINSLYGTSGTGTVTDGGTIYRITPAGVLTTLHTFGLGDPANGAYPFGELLQGVDGNFYGTTWEGGVTLLYGTLYMITPSGVFTLLHSFGQGGCAPLGGLIQDAAGDLYGTTIRNSIEPNSGPTDHGTVFKFTLPQSSLGSGLLTTLHTFLGPDGTRPIAALVAGKNGTFYGTTIAGGAPAYSSTGANLGSYGTVFSIDSSGNLITLHSFQGSADGTPPTTVAPGTAVHFTPLNGLPSLGLFPASIARGSDGNLYGTTFFGGPDQYGTVFKVDSLGNVTTLYTFSSNDVNFMPNDLIQGSDGNLYGTTNGGYYVEPGQGQTGVSALGSVWRLTPAGTLTYLHIFSGAPDGAYANTLIEGSDGNFYGTTMESWGVTFYGTIFKVTSDGQFTTIYDFATAGGLAGALPNSLVQGSDGNLYGIAEEGGPNGGVFGTFLGNGILDNGYGTVFKVTPGGTETTLWAFTGGSDGMLPASLIQGKDGNFYGTTLIAPGSYGSVFQITPSGALTTLFRYGTNLSDGATPGNLAQGPDGNFYGVTAIGGTATDPTYGGTVFQLTPGGDLTVFSLSADTGVIPPIGCFRSFVLGSDNNFYGVTKGGGVGGVGTIYRLARSPIQPTSVVSRKTHGTAGTFDVDLTSGNGIESRSGGTSGDYTLVLTFANPLTSVGSATVGSGTGSVASSNIDSSDAHNYIVNLNGVTNAQTITVNLNNVTDSAGNVTSGVPVSMGVLLGDVDATGRVDGNDVSAVQSHTRQTTDGTNYRYDVDVTGRIDGNDVSTTQGQTRTSLP